MRQLPTIQQLVGACHAYALCGPVLESLKKAILHRKNSQFYKTKNGAGVGDLFMSLIHTCELNGANPFDYLIELQKHASDLAKNPAVWMPWNYQEILGKAGTQPPR